MIAVELILTTRSALHWQILSDAAARLADDDEADDDEDYPYAPPTAGEPT